jgi:hypothetical protein
MVVTNPFEELNDLQGDDSDSEQLRSGKQEEEFGSNPSDSEGASTQPAYQKPHSKRGYIPINNLSGWPGGIEGQRQTNWGCFE